MRLMPPVPGMPPPVPNAARPDNAADALPIEYPSLARLGIDDGGATGSVTSTKVYMLGVCRCDSVYVDVVKLLNVSALS